MKTLIAKRGKYNDEVSLHTGRKPSGRIRDPIIEYLCYIGWKRVTGIKLAPGEIKEFELREVITNEL